MTKLFFVLFSIFGLFVASYAGGPSIWSTNARSEVLRGDAHGVSIDDSGAITLAPKLTEVTKTDQPYIWSSAADRAGNIFLGTGSDGKIFKITNAGNGAVFADLPELNVTALVFGRGGELFAATSPDGKVYQLDSAGKFTVFFDPKQKYIWSLAVLTDGSVAVGTGENGRIYRVRAANADPAGSLLFDTSETHIISLAVDGTGNLYAGTDPGGLVLRFGADGKPFALLDADLREIHDIDIGPDGSVYALALGESAAKPTATPTPSTTETKPAAATTPVPPAKSKYDIANARSAVFRILPDGGNDLIWISQSVSAFSLYAHQTGGGVLIGTSDKGRIYSVTNDGRETLALQTDASQISTIASVGDQLIATSSNQGSLFKIGPEPNAEGPYVSSVLDAKSPASWGRIWWQSAGNILIETRSGNTNEPDETWSAWAAAGPSSQVSSPKSRFLQWRAILKKGAAPPRLNEVNVAFLPRNIAPEVLAIQVFPTNVGLIANPAPQIDPNIALSGLDPGAFGIASANVAPRRVYQRGATSLQWTADDRNDDKLVYDVLYRTVGDSTFKPLRENIDETFVTIDGQSLADGRYVFKIVAKDSPSNPASIALSGERITDPVEIDNTPPTVSVLVQPAVSGNTSRVTFSASDKSSYLTKAEFSVNGGDWQTVYADDGISDSPNESYTVQLMLTVPGEYVVTLRAFDVNGNSGNARAIVRK
jgi:sugar lactone lactonase YvrE